MKDIGSHSAQLVQNMPGFVLDQRETGSENWMFPSTMSQVDNSAALSGLQSAALGRRLVAHSSDQFNKALLGRHSSPSPAYPIL